MLARTNFRTAAATLIAAGIALAVLEIGVRVTTTFSSGDAVPLEHTCAEQLQHLRADLRVLNFGVPAYGTVVRFRRDALRASMSH
jgi:hypothetical protein